MRATEARQDVQEEMRRHMAEVERATTAFTRALMATVKMRHRMTASTLNAAVFFEHADADSIPAFPPFVDCARIAQRDLDRAWIQQRAHKRLRRIAEQRMRKLIEISGEKGTRINALMAQIDGITLAKEPAE